MLLVMVEVQVCKIESFSLKIKLIIIEIESTSSILRESIALIQAIVIFGLMLSIYNDIINPSAFITTSSTLKLIRRTLWRHIDCTLGSVPWIFLVE